MKRQQQGFTLIELVIVIVILGILSAFALPRFADLGGDARAASIKGVAGSIKSASSIARSACLASDTCDQNSSDDSIDLEGQSVSLAFGYPVADTDASNPDGIMLASQISEDDFAITSGNTGGNPIITIAAEGASGSCEVAYTQAEDATTPPVIDTDDSNC